MLGEEISESVQMEVLAGERDFWCLDPIDGTTNFHATMPLFSVSLGLVRDGEVVLGDGLRSQPGRVFRRAARPGYLGQR